MNNYTKEQIYNYGMRDIKGYEELYAVTSCGRVWSYKRKRFLKPAKNKNGYLKVNLYKNGKMKTCRIHRLVAETYIPNPDNLPQVNHCDENKENNCINNLEWCDSKYNINYGTRTERTSKKVRCIETKEVYPSLSIAAKENKISIGNLSSCCNGRYKTTGGKHFMFEDDYQDILVAKLLEKVFCGDEESETDGADMITVCGQPLNEYLQTKNN